MATTRPAGSCGPSPGAAAGRRRAADRWLGAVRPGRAGVDRVGAGRGVRRGRQADDGASDSGAGGGHRPGGGPGRRLLGAAAAGRAVATWPCCCSGWRRPARSCSGCPTPSTGSPGGRCSPGGRLGLGWYLWSAARRRAPAPHHRRACPPVGSRPPASWPCSPPAPPSSSGPPRRGRRATVLVLPGPADAPERQVVLASPDLLKQIDALAAAGTPHGAVIVTATYEGKSADDRAEFEARLQVHNFEDGPVTLPLPFADVRLQDDGLLDGAPARLIAAPPVRPGFSSRSTSRGRHRLVVHFRVPMRANGSERAGALPRPAGAAEPADDGRAGERDLVPGPDPARLRGALRIARRRDGGPLCGRAGSNRRAAAAALARGSGRAPAPALRVREAYLWSLRPDTASLTAVLHYTVTRGRRRRWPWNCRTDSKCRGWRCARPRRAGRRRR